MKYGIVLTLLGVAGAVRADNTAVDQKSASKVGADWIEAWNRHDPAAMAALFGEHGDVVNPMGDVAKGHDQVLKLFQQEQAGKLKTSTMAQSCDPARFIGPAVAELDCAFTLTGVIGADGAIRGHVTDVVVEENGRWGIASMRAMVPVPVRPPQAVKTAEAPK